MAEQKPLTSQHSPKPVHTREQVCGPNAEKHNMLLDGLVTMSCKIEGAILRSCEVARGAINESTQIAHGQAPTHTSIDINHPGNSRCR